MVDKLVSRIKEIGLIWLEALALITTCYIFVKHSVSRGITDTRKKAVSQFHVTIEQPLLLLARVQFFFFPQKKDRQHGMPTRQSCAYTLRESSGTDVRIVPVVLISFDDDDVVMIADHWNFDLIYFLYKE